MDGLRSIIPLSKESLRSVVPAEIIGAPPRIEWVDPKTLFVEESYQRQMTERGTSLVRGIVSRFSWAKFKLPVCVELPEWDNVRVCIDGQHTATAAASHPGVTQIPVMIVDGVDEQARASSFVAHNRDRIALTAMAIFHAEVASGEENASEVAAACKEAGATILPGAVNLRLKQAVGATIAVGAMKNVVKRRGRAGLVQVLKVLIAAGRGPMKAGEITATDIILSSKPEVEGRLARTIASKTAEAWAALAMMAASSDVRRKHPDALASLWLREMKLTLAERAVLPARPEPAKKAEKPAAPPPALKKPPPATVLPPAPPKEVILLDAKPNAKPIVEYNGVSIDLRTREVSHRGAKAKLSDDGVRLVAALSRVMPSLLPEDILARKAFNGTPVGARDRLKALMKEANVVLRPAALEVRSFPIGIMLAQVDAPGG